MGFRRIYYDNYSNTIHLWETMDGKTNTIKTKPDIEYYIPDPSGQSDKKDIWGNSVKLQVSKTRKAMKDFLSVTKLQSCEASLGEDLKFLQRRYGNKNLTVNIDDFQVATLDIELKSGKTFPTNIADIVPYEINCISIYYSKTGEMITYGTQEYTGNDESVKQYHYIPDEKRMLEKFIFDFRKRRVDIVTGWNLKLFDMPYIINRCEKLGIELSLSPVNNYNSISIKDNFGNKKNAYEICGISILDGVESYRKFTYKKRVNYKLGTIATIETGEGKLDLGGQINHVYKTNWNRYVEYNVQDVNSTKNIEAKKKFIPLIINFCYQALIPFERVYSTIALVTGYFVRYLHRKNIMFPDPPETHKELYPGAYVYALPGLFEYLMSFDVESEYPHMIMMYNISPETLVLNPTDTTGLIKTPASKFYECETPKGHFKVSGIYYRKDKKGILPEIVEEIFNNRKYNKQKSKIADGMEKGFTLEQISENNFLPLDFVEKLMGEIKEEGYSAEYYDSQQLIMKILINSMYGVLGNPHFAFYNVHNAMAITIGGRHLIKFLSDMINQYMKERWHRTAKDYFPEYIDKELEPIKEDVVVLVDTDSNYIRLDEVIKNMGIDFDGNNEAFREFANEMDKRFFKPFFNNILNMYADTFGVKQMINFKREKIIIKKLTLAKKKYADLVIDDEGKTAYKDGTLYTDKPKLSITGIETVKTTTPTYCKTHLETLMVDIMVNKDRNKITDQLGAIYDEFYETNIEDISKNVSVKSFSKYEFNIGKFIEDEQIVYPPHCPQHVKAAVNYNYLVNKYDLELETVGDGTDIKLIYVHPNNELGTEVIGYIGKYPKEFNDIFRIDYEAQWQKQFKEVLQRFYDVIDWGEVEVDTTCASDFIDFS